MTTRWGDLPGAVLAESQEPSSPASRAGSSVGPAPELSARSQPLEHIENRGVSASFLTQLSASCLTDAMKREATAGAIAFLKSRIVAVEREIVEERASGTRTANPQPELEPEPRPAHSQTESEGGPAWYMSRQMATLEYSKQDMIANLERDLAQHKEDLVKRESQPYLTTRDVHELLVVAQTKNQMCRYVELGGVHGGKDEAGRAWVGVAQYFFSHNWDSPWDSVVSALQAHTERQVAAGKPPPYYWIDIFAVNQHARDAVHNGRSLCGACSTCRANKWDPLCDACVASACQNCAGCKAVGEDMHDWATADPNNLKGFERVIAHVKHTLVLNEPWDCPRPPTRVWCLFEGYQTLSRGGELEVVLGKAAQRELQLSLSARFGDIQSIVDKIDARSANASVDKDRDNIFSAIERLPGGFDGLNEKLRKQMQRWLCESAELVIYRTDPNRPPLTSEEMKADLAATAAKLAHLLEQFPRLPFLLRVLGCMFLGMCLTAGTVVWQHYSEAGNDHSEAGNDHESWLHIERVDVIYWWLASVFFVAVFSLLAGMFLNLFQEQRQLRQPSAFGNRVTARVNLVENILSGTVMVLLPVCLWIVFRFPWRIIVGVVFGAGGLVLGLVDSIKVSRRAAAIRASLRTKVGWLRIRLGDVRGVVAKLTEAHAELQAVVGSGDVHTSWVVAAALVRALCDVDRDDEACRIYEKVKFAKDNADDEDKKQWARFGPLLLAGVAAARRSDDADVLRLLEESIAQACWIPAGSRWIQHDMETHEAVDVDVDLGFFDTNLPEWNEFLDRMHRGLSETEDGDEESGTTPEATSDTRRMWDAYRRAIIQLTHKRLSGSSDASMELKARMFEHPAWRYGEALES